MKYIFGFIILCIVASCAAQAQVYTNQYGQPVGRAVTVNGTTYYSGQYGQPIGTSTPMPTTLQPPPPPQLPAPLPVLPILPIMPIMPVIK